jgi:hypothetical protein
MSLWVIVDDSIAVDELLAGPEPRPLAALLADLVTHRPLPGSACGPGGWSPR